MNSNSPIGVFDSGLGGLTVLKALRHLLPNENIIFVGDSARAPYGSRSPKEIIDFLQQFMDYFASRDVKMAVCACNTMTSYGYPLLKGKTPFPLVPMNPAIIPAAKASFNKHIGVIATKATITKGMHKTAAAYIDSDIEVYGVACPRFVPLIESGHIEGAEIEAVVKHYVQEFAGKNIHSLILGCTHYPIIRKVLAKYFGKDVALINPAFETAKDAATILRQHNLLNTQTQRGSLELRFSAQKPEFADLAKLVLGSDIPPIANVDLTKYATVAK